MGDASDSDLASLTRWK
nr:hypothetical protein [Pseudomonas fluorescens]